MKKMSMRGIMLLAGDCMKRKETKMKMMIRMAIGVLCVGLISGCSESPKPEGAQGTGGVQVVSTQNKDIPPPNSHPMTIGSQFVDREGKDLPPTEMPNDLREAVQKLPVGEGLTPGNPFALVLAQVALPADETNTTYSSQLVGKNWNGGMHYLSAGGACTDVNLRNPVCIRLLDFERPCNLEIQKMGYKTATLAVPATRCNGKVVWMGEIPLVRYGSEVGSTVKGAVVTAGGQLLAATGEVTLRVNGTNDRRKDTLKDGCFSFTGVTPGKYLVEFWIDTHSVAT